MAEYDVVTILTSDLHDLLALAHRAGGRGKRSDEVMGRAHRAYVGALVRSAETVGDGRRR
jgi:hypothetical protein